VSELPGSPQAFAGASWEEIRPYYEGLSSRRLDETTVEAWLLDWSALEELIIEASRLASIAYSADTTDPDKEALHLRFATEVVPKAQEQQVRLGRRLIELGYRREGLETLVRRMSNQIELFRQPNVALIAEDKRLGTRYQKITGAMTADWDGAEKTVAQLRAFQLNPDRQIRERAFRLAAQPYIEARDELADIFDSMYEVRQKIAANAGFENFRDFAHLDKNRFDYTPEDCRRFHESVEQTFVPALGRLYERRRKEMGLETTRPWDVGVDAGGRPPLKPYDTIADLVQRTTGIFERVDPVLGGYFRTMAGEELLDLDSRKGKAPGGYCTPLPHRRRSFIFMNAAGVAADVRVLIHESGHAFHNFEAFSVPLLMQRHAGSEMAEVASMSMELLTSPYLDTGSGGYYGAQEARRARAEHLEGILQLMPHVASVDAFQQWIYTDPDGASRDARDEAWLRIRQRFDPSLDWTGLRPERVARWYSQLHFFMNPFYYIEYGIAQLGALQVWRRSLEDHPAALKSYRYALSLGGTQPLPQLFGAAGARLAFDAELMGSLVSLLESQLEELRS
jgi:oligoendopeptidase F